MNKVLQEVLVLDTETSKKLKKGGKVDVLLSGIVVHITIDDEKELHFTTEERKQEVIVKEFEDNVIYMKKDKLQAILSGTAQEISSGILSYDKENDKFILKPKEVDKVKLVLYR